MTDLSTGPARDAAGTQGDALGALNAKTKARQRVLLLGGGVPLKVGDEVIGAIGVAGAGGAKNDEACAVAAIEKLLPSSH